MALVMILVVFVIRNAIFTYQCLISKKDFWISCIFLGKYLNASQEYIDNAIEMFKKDLIESYHVTLL